MIGRYLLDVELRQVEIGLCPDVHGHRRDHSVQMVLRDVAEIVRKMPRYWLVVADIERFFERVPVAAALDRLLQHDVPGWVVAWIRRFHKKQGDRYPGMTRGISWSALLSSLYLEPFDLLAQQRSLIYRRVGDDIIAVVRDRDEADALVSEACATLADLGLSFHADGHRKALHVAPVAAPFQFLGVDFEGGLAHPPEARIDALVGSLQACGDDDARRTTLAGWAGHYLVCASSPRLLECSQALQRRWPHLPSLDQLVERAATRAHLREHRNWDRARALGMTRLRATATTRPTGNSSLRAHPRPVAVPGSPGSLKSVPVAAGSRAASSRRPAEDYIELVLPHQVSQLPRLDPGELWALAGSSGWSFIMLAETLDLIARRRLYRRLGFTSWSAFCRLWLAEDPQLVRRVVLVGLAALDATATEGERVAFEPGARSYDEIGLVHPPPVGLLKKLVVLRSDGVWAWGQRSSMLHFVATGLASSTEAKRSVSRSIRRACRRSRSSRAGRVRWWLKLSDGTVIDENGAKMNSA